MPASEGGAAALTAGAVRPGHEAQADGIHDLLRALDAYLARRDAAQTARDEAVGAATRKRDRAQQGYDQSLEETLAAVQQRQDQANEEIATKIGSKLDAARATFKTKKSRAEAKHTDQMEHATREREETIWLAETVLESALRTAKLENEKLEKQIKERSGSIGGLEARLGEALGPKHAAAVAQTEATEPAKPESPSVQGLADAIRDASEALDRLSKGGLFKLLRGKKKTIALGVTARDLNIAARVYADALVKHTQQQFDAKIESIHRTHDKEIREAEKTLAKKTDASDTQRDDPIREATEAFEARSAELEARRAADLAELDRWQGQQRDTAQAKHAELTEAARAACAEVVDAAEASFASEHAAARAELVAIARECKQKLDATADRSSVANPPWADAPTLAQPSEVPLVVDLAHLRLDLGPRLERLEADLRDEIGMPSVLDAAAVLSLPGPRSLLIRHDAAGRDAALANMRTVMLRVLSSFPGGKVRFTMADPVGMGQSFAGFMRLSDQEPSPVGSRIWSEPAQIERQLADLTEHMQTVIQKYLRADFETIEDYNHAAGEIAEQYRFLIIADVATALTDTGAARLKSILESGPRCGVYTLLTADAAAKLSPNLTMETIEANSTTLVIEGGSVTINDPRFAEAEVSLLDEPADALAARVLDRVALAGAAAGRVEVPFERLAPPDRDLWTRTCEDELIIPLGRSGAQRIQELRLGSGTRQHALIAGRTGSGKSTLLHVIVSAATLWHSPDELEIYLIDFKKGVEFKAYTGGRVPHVRAVAIESDREFGLSVLKRLDEEITARGDLFRKLGSQNLAMAREASPGTPLPRVLLLIDEFQEFFTEDDEVASEATLLLDRLVRQGRAFGVHVVLGSQTLAGAYSLARSTLGQIGVRVALQCSEADSYLILGEDNNAARLLERPGEAIYNNAGGLVEGNSPFQTAWLPDAVRDSFIRKMPAPTRAMPEAVVFEGNRPAQLDVSAAAFAHAVPDRTFPKALLGDAVAIAPPTAASLQKRSGSNLVIVSSQPEPAMGMLVSAAVSAGCTPNTRLVVIDPTPEDDGLHGRLSEIFAASGLDARVETHRQADAVVTEIAELVRSRGESAGDPVLLVLVGVHRLRSLRRSDDYSFSLDDSGASPDKELASVLREGPAAGVWTLAWCDTLTNLERAMERATVREFGLRVLTQMSASDSASLVDSSVASNLGPNRALLADDVAGTLSKFRPIDLPSPETTARAVAALRR